MDSTPASKILKNNRGIALFMVMASVSMLAILVTEFVYIAQISQSIAYGGLDQMKAHYLAKSGLKISLLRLKAYQQAKKTIESMGGGSGAGEALVPKGLLEKIWSFPFMYPIPTNIPGMNPSDKAAIDKFQKESSIDGKFTALIESESSKYNLKMILSSYATQPSPTPSPSGTSNNGANGGSLTGDSTGQGNSPPPNPTPSFNPEVARNSLREFLETQLQQKFEADPDFAALYRDFRIDDFMDGVSSWADRTYERRTSNSHDKIPMKRAPFYSLSELHMLPHMDDEIFKLFGPTLTVNPTPGLNINTIKEATLRALVPQMTPDEVKEFFKFRDSEEADNLFKSVDKFYEYLQKSVARLNNPQTMTQFKESLAKRNITLVTEESQFKITVRAQVNQSVRTIEAWVTLLPPNSGGSGISIENPQQGGNQNQISGNLQNNSNPFTQGKKQRPSSGLQITYMRIL